MLNSSAAAAPIFSIIMSPAGGMNSNSSNFFRTLRSGLIPSAPLRMRRCANKARPSPFTCPTNGSRRCTSTMGPVPPAQAATPASSPRSCSLQYLLNPAAISRIASHSGGLSPYPSPGSFRASALRLLAGAVLRKRSTKGRARRSYLLIRLAITSKTLQLAAPRIRQHMPEPSRAPRRLPLRATRADSRLLCSNSARCGEVATAEKAFLVPVS